MEGLKMKKFGFIVGGLGAAFGIAVYSKMRKLNLNKNSVKRKAKEAFGSVSDNKKTQTEGVFNQVIGATQEVFEDIKDLFLPSNGTNEKISGKLKKTAENFTDNSQQKAKSHLEQTVGETKQVIADVKRNAKDVYSWC